MLVTKESPSTECGYEIDEEPEVSEVSRVVESEDSNESDDDWVTSLDHSPRELLSTEEILSSSRSFVDSSELPLTVSVTSASLDGVSKDKCVTNEGPAIVLGNVMVEELLESLVVSEDTEEDCVDVSNASDTSEDVDVDVVEVLSLSASVFDADAISREESEVSADDELDE